MSECLATGFDSSSPTEGPTLRHEIEIRESDQFSASLTEEIERDTQCVKDVHTHPNGVTHL